MHRREKNPTSQSGFFDPRSLLALALCSCGIFLGIFSLAATSPNETTRASSSVRPDPANFVSTFGNQPPAPPDVQRSAQSETMPLASATASDWSIVASPNASATNYNYLEAVTCGGRRESGDWCQFSPLHGLYVLDIVSPDRVILVRLRHPTFHRIFGPSEAGKVTWTGPTVKHRLAQSPRSNWSQRAGQLRPLMKAACDGGSWFRAEWI